MKILVLYTRLTGVRCKTYAILSVGSIANSDLEPYTIYQGNPAKKIRNRVIEAWKFPSSQQPTTAK